MMDETQELIFGDFPRSVGVTTPDRPGSELKQYMVNSRTEMDGVIEKVSGRRNIYSSVSSYHPHRRGETYSGYSIRSDKVSYDFDSSAKADSAIEGRWNHPSIADDVGDEWVVRRIKEDDEIRESVLGDVCDDVQRLAQSSIDEGIPVVGIFSGFGIHVHQLYEATNHRVEDKLSSNSRRWVSELSLSTVDSKASGKQYRIMRFPNVERMIHGASVEHSGIYTVPLSGSELTEITPDDLIEFSDTPRVIESLSGLSRPSMTVQEEFLGPGESDDIGQEKMRSVPTDEIGSELARHVIKDIVKMPCVYERALTRNPPNDVRVKLGAMLLNAGYTPSDATDLIAEIGWVDFDRSVTKYQLEKLRESGKGDYSCNTMRMKGLCVHADSPKDCELYGYNGGNTPQ